MLDILLTQALLQWTLYSRKADAAVATVPASLALMPEVLISVCLLLSVAG
jgi:hypothetical protein